MGLVDAFRGWVAAAMCVLAACTPLDEKAEHAREALAKLVAPPPVWLAPGCLQYPADAAPMREYVLAQQAEAVTALLASATPGEEGRVRDVFQEMIMTPALPTEAARRLADVSPGGLVGARLADSLGEIRFALQERMDPDPCRNAYVGFGRTQQELGGLARPDYERLVEAEPDNPWYHLVLAWLSGTEGEAALTKARALAETSADPAERRVAIFVLQQRAWLAAEQGRPDAATLAAEAHSLAEVRVEGASSEERWRAERDEAQSASVLAGILARTQSPETAASLESATLAHRTLVNERPDDEQAQMALVVALEDQADLTDDEVAAASHRAASADRLWALQLQTPFAPTSSTDALLMAFLFRFLVAALLALFAAPVLLWWYRRRIARFMQAPGTATATSGAAPSLMPATGRPRKTLDLTPPGRRRAAARTQNYAGFVHVVAGLVYGGIAALLLFAPSVEWKSLKAIAIVAWGLAWPTLLSLRVVWDGDRSRQRWVLVGYVVGLLLLIANVLRVPQVATVVGGVTISPFVQLLWLWLSSVVVSVPIVLPLALRGVRSVSPVLFVLLTVLMLGSMITLVFSATPAGRNLLSPVFGVWGNLGLAGSVVMSLLGALLVLPLAWWAVGRLRDAYVAHWASDQSLMLDAVWGMHTIALTVELLLYYGLRGLLGVVPFLVHKAIVFVAMTPARRSIRDRQPFRLLLLRVFGRRRPGGGFVSRRKASEQLFDLLSTRWRYLGPVEMIGAPDVASRTIDPPKVLDFLSGRLHDRFLLDVDDLAEHLASVDTRSDHDARWRVTELFCGDDAWKPAVLQLARRSDVVVMDLRDFGKDNQGCVFELQVLVDSVPADHVALLVDETTEKEFLSETLDACLDAVPPDSPNTGRRAEPVFIDVSQGVRAAVREVSRLADAAGA